MSGIENAKKMSKQEVLDKIAASGILEYGLHHETLSERIRMAEEEAQEERLELGVVAALNNADTDGVLLEVLKENPEKVTGGIAILGYALGTDKLSLHIPESAAELADLVKDAAEAENVEIVTGLVNKRAEKGSVLMHMITAAGLSDVLEDSFVAGIYVSANGAELKKVACDTKLSDIVDLSEAKAVLAGYRYIRPETAAALTVGEAEIDNGLLRILTEKDCIVAETDEKLTASRKQSCGRCVFCREGLLQLQYMNNEIKEGRGKPDYIDMTKEIGEAMEFSTPCTMGQVSAKIVLSAVELFEKEYELHMKKKTCPAGVCFSAQTIYIDPRLCSGCGDCADVCPKDCIDGKPKYIYMIDDFDCDRCGKCIPECSEEAIVKTSGKVPKLPNKLTKVGKFRKH